MIPIHYACYETPLYCLLTGCVGLAEAFALYEGISKTFGSGLSPIWGESDFLIVWNLLVRKAQHANEVHLFVDSIRNFYLSRPVKGFLLVNYKSNFITCDLAYNAPRFHFSTILV